MPGTPPPMPLLGAEELDQMLGPIALYPDPLLAQLLPAATYPLDIVKAARQVRAGATAAQIDQQDWDPSVQAVAHYPSVIEMLDTNLDWTQQLGQAFIAQPEDVMQSVQRLRAQARAVGNLVDTPQAQVLVDDDLVRIVPADPRVIYVPVYEPAVVYYMRPVPFGAFLYFGFGFAAGAWLDLDCDWRGRFFYRPGWTWDHWRDNIFFEHERVVRVNRSFEWRRGERPPTVWQRNVRKPLLLPGRPITRPGQFDAFRGRERVQVPRTLPPPPRIDTDRGRTRVPAPRQPGHVFDPRQPESEADRSSHRGAESQQGVPVHPAVPPGDVREPGRGPPPVTRDHDAKPVQPPPPARDHEPKPVQPPPARDQEPKPVPPPVRDHDAKPVQPPPARDQEPKPVPVRDHDAKPVQPQPARGQEPKPVPPPARVGTPPVKIAPPPPAATAPSRPVLTGEGPAVERGKNSRGHD